MWKQGKVWQNSPLHNLSMQMMQLCVSWAVANRVTGSFEQMDAFTSSLLVKSITVMLLLSSVVRSITSSFVRSISDRVSSCILSSFVKSINIVVLLFACVVLALAWTRVGLTLLNLSPVLAAGCMSDAWQRGGSSQPILILYGGILRRHTTAARGDVSSCRNNGVVA
jgi:hypothetical protein